MRRNFSEDGRVKVPAIIHLTRLGYRYRSTRKIRPRVDMANNIYLDSFLAALNRLNNAELAGTELQESDALQIIRKIHDELQGEDLGHQFFIDLKKGIGYQDHALRLIDFDTPANNSFEVVTEMPCGDDDESFRPDITLYINGLPLAFIEAKIPNNRKGMQAEYERMVKRSKNKKFRAYINETQIMVFSNNMEYDNEEMVPICGAFYATAAYGHLFFNHFREEDTDIQQIRTPIDPAVQTEILRDTNMVTLLHTAEYDLNQEETTPTNRVLTSLFLPERFLFLLRYGICYVEKANDKGVVQIEKHIMRYQQFFASRQILRCVRQFVPVKTVYKVPETLEATKLVAEKDLPKPRVRGGVIWHTQGSGKTELAFYNVKILTDFYARHHISAKFYFIVDRLDLMTQAGDEFRERGLNVVEVPNRDAFIENIQSTSEQTNQMRSESSLVINVVNIQKFSDEAVTKAPEYNVNIQRIYFIDEAHRDFKETGEYLARLVKSDRQAIKIALTGTPLIGKVKTKDIFGDYLHKYYYNMSIKDRYTLRLIREGIKTEYRLRLNKARNVLEQEVLKGSLKKKLVTSQAEYIEPLVDYIEDDFSGFQLLTADDTAGEKFGPVGAIIVCDSSEQAAAVQEELERRAHYSSSLVLSRLNESRDTTKEKRDTFKKGGTDFLVVYNMLLTGFDAPRLKKMYLGRKIKNHNLLQALTRVNRPYGRLKYGYIVDFADIRKEFDKTNQAYLVELKEELGDSYQQYASIFKTTEEIQQDLSDIQEHLFSYDTNNLEAFERQIDDIEDKKTLIELRRVLRLYKELHNLSELFGYEDILSQLEPDRVKDLSRMVENRIGTLNDIEASQDTTDMDTLIKAGTAQLEITFKKVSEGEMALADGYYLKRNNTLKEFERNTDQKDPEYVKLKDELKRVLENHNMREMTLEEMQAQDEKLEQIRQRAHELNEENRRLTDKYSGDDRYMRLHKRYQHNALFPTNTLLFTVLSHLKEKVDSEILMNSHFLDNNGYFQKLTMKEVRAELLARRIQASPKALKEITIKLSNELYEEYKP